VKYFGGDERMSGFPAPSLVAHIALQLTEALGGLAEPSLVDLLDFVVAQHSGSSFDPDNTRCVAALSRLLAARPFAVSEEGVDALAQLAAHALGRAGQSSSTAGRATSPDHQLWLLASAALNTAAAIQELGGGDAAAAFACVERGGAARSRYMQRSYATESMRRHVAAGKRASGKPRDGIGAASPLTMPALAGGSSSRSGGRGLTPLVLLSAAATIGVVVLGARNFGSTEVPAREG
jgi:hypothetical protein